MTRSIVREALEEDAAANDITSIATIVIGPARAMR